MYVKKSGIESRINRYKMAETEYSKVFSRLKGNLRGLQYDEGNLLNHLKEIDYIISSNCPSYESIRRSTVTRAHSNLQDHLIVNLQMIYENLQKYLK